MCWGEGVPGTGGRWGKEAKIGADLVQSLAGRQARVAAAKGRGVGSALRVAGSRPGCNLEGDGRCLGSVSRGQDWPLDSPGCCMERFVGVSVGAEAGRHPVKRCLVVSVPVQAKDEGGSEQGTVVEGERVAGHWVDFGIPWSPRHLPSDRV